MAAVSPGTVLRVLYQPSVVFGELAGAPPSAISVFFRIAFWLLALPPAFAYFGSLNFGWDLGAGEPVVLTRGAMAAVSAAYFLTLIFGFVSVAVVARWMAQTYGARDSFGAHFALIAMVGTPVLLGSAIHLYPHAFINLVVLAPALMWSMYLLYTGLPVVLGIDPQRGMLMASALIAYLLVAAVSLLGLTVVLWGHGIGPTVGI
jgi:hypothetical protein